MALSELAIESRWTYQDAEFKRMMRDVDSTKERVVAANTAIDTSTLRSARNVAHLTTAFLSLEGTVKAVGAGQMSVLEGALRLIPTFVSMAAAIWGVVSAENARTVSSGVAHSVSSLGLLTPIVIAAAAAAAVGLAAYVTYPRMHEGGVIPMTGPYLMKAGETVFKANTPSVNLTVPSSAPQNFFNVSINVGSAREATDVMDELKAGGYV